MKVPPLAVAGDSGGDRDLRALDPGRWTRGRVQHRPDPSASNLARGPAGRRLQKAGVPQVDLFSPDDGHYEYSAGATNKDLSVRALWHLMAGRGAHEKTLAELKQHYGFASIPTNDRTGQQRVAAPQRAHAQPRPQPPERSGGSQSEAHPQAHPRSRPYASSSSTSRLASYGPRVAPSCASPLPHGPARESATLSGASAEPDRPGTSLESGLGSRRVPERPARLQLSTS